MISILIPAFNEEQSIETTVTTLHRILTEAREEFEILVINDGSTDGTAAILKRLSLPGFRAIHSSQNNGYSFSLKTGIRHSKGDLIGMVDADGTYPITEFPKLLSRMRETEADMVVGARTKKGVEIPMLRRPGKAIINALARNLTGMRIPDLNSGMRIFTRTLAVRFLPLYPQRFSFTITITLAALTNGYIVEYVPIEYFKRTGKSSLSSGMNGIKNFMNFLSLIIRIVTSFRPLRFFIWPGVLLVGTGIAVMCYTVFTQANVSDTGLLLFLSGLQIGLFGVLGEAIIRNRSVS